MTTPQTTPTDEQLWELRRQAKDDPRCADQHWFILFARAAIAASQGVTAAPQEGKTGWPPGMLQDDDRGLSRWLASKPNARQEAREAAQSIVAPRFQQTYCQRCGSKCGPGDDGPIDCGGHAPLAAGAQAGDATRLLHRALRQLERWSKKYGEWNPSWLPPAGDVELAEDIEEYIAKRSVPGTPPDTGNVGAIDLLMQSAEDYADEAVNHGLYAPATYEARDRLRESLCAEFYRPQDVTGFTEATEYPTLADKTDNPNDVNTLLVPFVEMERLLSRSRAKGGLK